MNPGVQRLVDAYKEMMQWCVYFDSTTIPAEHNFDFSPNTHFLVQACNLEFMPKPFNKKVFKVALKQWLKVLDNAALFVYLNKVEFATIPLRYIPPMGSCFSTFSLTGSPHLALSNKYPLLIPVSSFDVLHVKVVPLRKLKPLKNIRYTVSFSGILMSRPRNWWELRWFKISRWFKGMGDKIRSEVLTWR